MTRDQTETVPKSKVTTTLIFVATVFFGISLVCICAIIPTWRNMFVDFGSKLPTATQIVFEWRIGFLAIGLVSIFGSYQVIFGKVAGNKWLLAALAIALFEFTVLIFALSALFMPIFMMGSVSA